MESQYAPMTDKTEIALSDAALDLKAIKRIYRDRHKEEKRAQRSRARRQRRCFWTWPLGHVFVPLVGEDGARRVNAREQCAACHRMR